MAAMRNTKPWSILVLFTLGLMASTARPAPPQNAGSPAPQQSPTPQQSPSPAAKAPQAEENQAEQFRAEAEEGIKHMLVSQIEAWNHGRLEAFMQGYWRSPELTFFSGATVTKGWEPTLERYRQRYKSEGKEMGQLEFQDLNIEALNRRTAVVTGHWHLTMSDGKKPNGLFTLIVKRMPGGWKIVHDHTSAE
jgi:beta-aspartyl-peptidase (threonine type)